MGKLLFITIMEAHFTGMREAVLHAGADFPVKDMEVLRVDDTETWNDKWRGLFLKADFVLVTWMGVGLSCPFLQESSRFMQGKHIRHFYNIIDPGDDLTEYGLAAEEKQNIMDYLACGGLQNYANLCLWLAKTFGGAACSCPKPQHMPWCGIYSPHTQEVFVDAADYLTRYCDTGKPTVGLLFSREEWLWRKLSWQDALIEALERQGCNVAAVFTTTLSNAATGAPGLAESLRRCFYADGRVYIDALINPFVFSLTVTGFLKLDDLQALGVPVLQAYNVYNDYEWWRKSYAGLSPNELSYAIAMPEFDGVIHSTPISTQEKLPDGTHDRAPILERIDMLARKAKKWALLRKKPNREKKIAIVFHNYPPTNANIGSASCLDSIESVRLLLEEMQRQGYFVERIPENSQAFIDEVTAHATNDRRFISEALLKTADGRLSRAEYGRFFKQLPERTRGELVRDWGDAPGDVFRYGDEVIIPGMLNGNVYVTVQPPRGFGDDPGKIYHSPDCAPTHHYLGVYYWLRDVWQADAMIHVGTHGNLEWLPGKGVAMSDTCYSDIATGDMPNVYPYWITCVGEGIQAKRRSAACLISYLSSPMSLAGSYEELAALEQLLEEYCHFRNDDGAQATVEKLQEMIRAQALECNLQEDVPESQTNNFDDYVAKLHVFVTDIKNMQISTGLHVLGCPPEDEELTEYLLALTKLDNGDQPSLVKTLAAACGYDCYVLLENSGCMLPDGSKTYGMLLDEIMERSRSAIRFLQERQFDCGCLEGLFSLPWTSMLRQPEREALLRVSRYICERVAPSLLLTTLEQENTLGALDGRYVDPSASGAPTSGGADLLPTGRNFYSIDPRALPTPAAWEIGKQMGEDVIAKFIGEEGRYPESVGIILWATSNLRNHGQCVAEFLYLMGVRPVWQKGSMRVEGIEVIPLDELKRPRVDVTGRISGLFRDSMPASVSWLDEAVSRIAALDEPLSMNYIRKHVLEDAQALQKQGVEETQARRQASLRIFGDPPGAHGAGVGAVLEAKNWDSVDDIAAVYARWGAHAYGAGAEGDYLPDLFKKRMSQIDITLQNVDHRESSMLSGDDYNSYRGGMVAAVRSAKGEMPKNYVSDSSDRSKVQIRSLDEELKRWFRGEAMNPKYIEGMKRHGYKGAGDLATYVSVSYQWDATSEVMEDWMYEKYAQKYAFDADMQAWMKEVNPWALHQIAEVLLEAAQRGLWQAKEETKEELQKLFLSLEGDLEERGDPEN